MGYALECSIGRVRRNCTHAREMRPSGSMCAERRSDRTRVSLPATVRAGTRSYRDVVTDLSLTGLFLQAETERLRAGERVWIAFSLPVGERTIPVEVDGVIARVVKDMIHRTKGMGVRFVRPRASAVDAIEAFLETLGGLEARATGLGQWSTAGGDKDERADTDPAEASPAAPADKGALPVRTYDFTAEAPDLDEGEGDTDPRFALPKAPDPDGAADTIDDNVDSEGDH